MMPLLSPDGSATLIPGDEYVYLLPYIDRKRRRMEPVNHLQYTHIDTFRVISRQAAFGDNVGVDANESQWEHPGGVAFQMCYCPASGPYARCVGFVDAYAHLQYICPAEQDGRICCV